MKEIKVTYGGFETEQLVDDAVYNAVYDKAIKDCSVIASKLIKCQGCPVNCDFGTEESCAEDLGSYFMKQLNGNENIKFSRINSCYAKPLMCFCQY